MVQPLRIAYINSLYARASDSFIRVEVGHLRKLGHTVRTYSVRRPSEQEIRSDDIRREREQTTYILTSENAGALATAFLKTLGSTPFGLISAGRRALRAAPPGMKGALWSMAYLVEACFLARELRAHSIEHLHGHFAEGSGAVAMLAAKLAGIPYSLTIHGPSEFDHAPTLALDQKIAHSAFTVAVSHYGRSQIMRWINVDDWEKIKLVHCGVADHFLSADPAPFPAERRFVFVGRLDMVKGLLPLIDAVRLLAEEGLQFKLIVIGDGPMRDTVQQKIERYQLGGCVELRGWMSSEEVHSEILNSTAFVLPSFAENLPVAIMEALALGRPVISTHIAGIPELVKDGVCGWLVPAASVPDLADAMREAITCSSDRLEQFGQAGAQVVARDHSAKTEAAKLSAHIEAVHCRQEAVDTQRDRQLPAHAQELGISTGANSEQLS